MRADFPDKEAISQELRLLMRSRHIYILFSALLHVLLGLYLRFGPKIWQKIFQSAGSAALLTSTFLLIWAFVAETYYARHFTDISRYGIYLTGAAVALHLIGGFGIRKNPTNH